jgi:hypothetical protein
VGGPLFPHFSLVNMAMVKAQNEKSEEKWDPSQFFVCFFQKHFFAKFQNAFTRRRISPIQISFFSKKLFLQILTKLGTTTCMAYTNFQQLSLVTLYKNNSWILAFVQIWKSGQSPSWESLWVGNTNFNPPTIFSNLGFFFQIYFYLLAKNRQVCDRA